MAEKYDDVLVPFVSLMRKELHANAGKGDRPGWLRMDANTALLEVYYHLSKLQKAVKHNDGPAIMEYSADVANMAMMVLDVCGGLALVEAGVMASDDWRAKAAAWLRAKADEQEATNRAYPNHAKCYPSWESRVLQARWLADDLEKAALKDTP